MSLPEGILFGMGNPLLDISAVVPSKFLEEFDMKPNNAILAEEKHTPMYDRLVNEFEVEYIAGGATQNSLRVAQWLLKTPHLCTFMGAVGSDDAATKLRESAEKHGVCVRYQVASVPTGKCAVLLTGNDRSLCAYLGAANEFKASHFDVDNNWSYVERARYYYISGFFLTVSPESIQKVAKFACENNRHFMMNLSAPFISQFFTDRLDAALPYVDILFGNETEAEAFATSHDFGTKDISEIAKKIVALPKENSKRPRVVVFTQGCGNVIVATENSVNEYPVEKLEQKDIVDTNGAGDAFVGGFLSQLVTGKEIEKCVKCGVWAATKVIQQSGCTFPKDTQYE